jgi:predicted heme/steroid binding protein
MTLAELAQYDGTDETKPLYLAINGTIYDVSSNRRTYGPGGSYSVFAGVDAARGFVTGCFQEDKTADMRGVEDMFLPLDDPEVDRLYTAAELETLKQAELESAQKRVYDALAHWVNFFENSPRYARVGFVKREKGWLEKEPRKKLCDQAAKGRSKRKIPGQE